MGEIVTDLAPPFRPSGDPISAMEDPAAWARETLEDLGLVQKVAQLMMPFILGDYAPEGSSAFERARSMVRDHGVGGLIVSVGSPTEVASKLNWLQSLSELPLLVAADLENGAGMRFDGIVHAPTRIELGGATSFPSMMALGATGDAELAYEMGRVTAIEARALGVHIPFAPVLDVNNDPENPVINVRSLGEDPKSVGRLGAAVVRGMQAHGAISTAKHFPGHGDTDVDSHLDLPVISVSRDRLRQVELVPFQEAVRSGLGAVMTAHVELPRVAGRGPATLSKTVLTDILADELGFRGLVFTDAMDMRAIRRDYGAGESAVLALEAGADVILMPPDLDEAINAVVDAVRSGRLTEERLDRSVSRVLAAKAYLGLDQSRLTPLHEVRMVVGAAPHQEAARRIAERAITVFRDSRDLLPLLGTRSAGVYSLSYRRRNEPCAGRAFNRRLGQTYVRLASGCADARTDNAERRAIMQRIRRSALTVISLYLTASGGGDDDHVPEEARRLVREAVATGRPVIVISFGNPYVLEELPSVQTYLAAWGDQEVAQEAAADAILGRFALSGRSPTRVGGYPVGHGLEIPAKR